MSEPIEDIVRQVRERRLAHTKLREQLSGQMDEETKKQGNPEKNQTLCKKYEPKAYLDLIGDEVINRGILKWLKSWEISVFGDKKYKSRTRETDAWKQNIPFKKSDFKPTSLYLQNKIMLDNTDLSIKDECEVLKNKIALIVGDSGTCKTSLAKVIAKHCKYEPVVVNMSTIKNIDELITIIKNETQSHSISDMQSSMHQKQDRIEAKKIKDHRVFGMVGGKETPDESNQPAAKSTKRPTCLILDEIDGFFNSDYSA